MEIAAHHCKHPPPPSAWQWFGPLLAAPPLTLRRCECLSRLRACAGAGAGVGAGVGG